MPNFHTFHFISRFVFHLQNYSKAGTQYMFNKSATMSMTTCLLVTRLVEPRDKRGLFRAYAVRHLGVGRPGGSGRRLAYRKTREHVIRAIYQAGVAAHRECNAAVAHSPTLRCALCTERLVAPIAGLHNTKRHVPLGNPPPRFPQFPSHTPPILPFLRVDDATFCFESPPL